MNASFPYFCTNVLAWRNKHPTFFPASGSATQRAPSQFEVAMAAKTQRFKPR
jgi:hypothetical protein